MKRSVTVIITRAAILEQGVHALRPLEGLLSSEQVFDLLDLLFHWFTEVDSVWVRADQAGYLDVGDGADVRDTIAYYWDETMPSEWVIYR